MSTIRLCDNDIDGDAVSCTGSQLATVFETIAQTVSLLDCVWHAADVDPSPGELARYGGKVRNPRQSGHRFRRKAAIDSDRKRPPNPIEGGHPVDRVRRGSLSAIWTRQGPPFAVHAMGG